MPAPTSSTVPPRVLVVDDEPRMLHSLCELLSLHGCEVYTASNGTEAIERLSGETFDLVLLDISMPDKDGFAVMDHVKESGKDVAIVVVSGLGEMDAAIRAMRFGAQDFLRKPYDAEQLLKTVDRVVSKRRSERQLHATIDRTEHSERWHRYLVNNSPDILYALDAAGRFTFLNDRVEALLGFERGELVGRHYTYLVVEDDWDRARNLFNERRTGRRATRETEFRLKQKRRRSDPAERQLTVEVFASGIYENSAADPRQKTFCGTYGVLKDVSERKRMEDAIHHQAYHDQLTGLPNRLLLRDRLNLAVAQAKRAGHMLAVMFLDLDRFKAVNDALGHSVGDQFLQGVAARLAKCVREGDTLARVGGDEFILLLPHIVTREAAENAARKVLSVLAMPFRLHEQDYYGGVSIGIALFPDDGDTIDNLIRNADVAMYDVKARGRNDFAFFSAGTPRPEGRSLEFDLAEPQTNEQFEVNYQPVVAADSGRIVALEALLRWNHPTKGQLLPAHFIPLAEQTGTISQLCALVIRNVAKQIAVWRAHGLVVPRVAINLSAQQIELPDFVSEFHDMLRASDVDPRDLDIEITESTMMRDMDATRVKLQALADLGLRIVIDDFGTGYSSLNYLRHLPIDSIKIDQSFVSDIKVGGENAIVTALILIAKGMNLKFIAEGVETDLQWEFLRRAGCDQIQGFLFSKPVSAETITRLLTEGAPLSPQTSRH